MKTECRICRTEVEHDDLSQYAAYGGLPSPCCKICFEVNDFTIESMDQLAGKSLLKRYEVLTTEETK